MRTGAAMEKVAPKCTKIPDNVILDDGLDEDEAVLTALSNNSAFQATLAQLGMAGGDAKQATLLANPQFLTYLPAGAKEGQYTLFAPIESYLLRPIRVDVANREYRRVGEQLVQNGLNLSRDVRVAYVDWALAQRQADLAAEAKSIRDSILQLTTKRLDKGDISELETIAAKVDSLNAKASLGVQRNAVNIAEARVATLIGLPELGQPLLPGPLPVPMLPAQSEEELVQQAIASRPDLQAAKWSVAAARQRSSLSRWLWLRLDGVLDVRSGNNYTRTGTGLRFDIPIFNRNQGGIMRADWERNAAQHNHDAISDQITQDVRTAYRQLQQAYKNLTILRDDVEPALVEALGIAQKGYEDGGADYLLVLQTTTQYLTARGQLLDQQAACCRALAELERSVGRPVIAPISGPAITSNVIEFSGLNENLMREHLELSETN
ncbi:Cobalt-zinc-cadmium resistance protein CzcC precursor [Stieleria magnilauensis]|uniref:Cobalt-zinc-cadmium resistance protein CzcC n=2 Tax=Stieleria magnilauensis TaxID=2527963 RepID=A0ABX5XUR0_9BACT|nr:Cobalt-zinc-cadmium resistance protein CzcC precursor [Planctomycetes bacterium TBK1r]